MLLLVVDLPRQLVAVQVVAVVTVGGGTGPDVVVADGQLCVLLELILAVLCTLVVGAGHQAQLRHLGRFHGRAVICTFVLKTLASLLRHRYIAQLVLADASIPLLNEVGRNLVAQRLHHMILPGDELLGAVIHVCLLDDAIYRDKPFS